MISACLNGSCDVWSVSLAPSAPALDALVQVLSVPERERAAAFLLPAPRQQFIVARAALRILLGRYLGTGPSTDEFIHNPYGKPALARAQGLHFNVSHAGQWVLIAVSCDCEVGVDVERHRPENDLDALARSVLCAEDLAHWRTVAAGEQATVFYRIWTCKEAIAKAIGCGMSMDFRSIRLDLAKSGAAALVSLAPDWGLAEEWSLRELALAPGYSAAIAAAAPKLQVMQRNLSL